MNIKTEPLYDGAWCAIDNDTYDWTPDGPIHPIGYGETEQEAIDDLLEQMEEAA